MKTVKLKICHGRQSQLVVSNQVVTNPCCGLSVIFCGFISHLIGRETINITEIFSGIHGFTGKTVTCAWVFVRTSKNFAHLATFQAIEFMEQPFPKTLDIFVYQTSENKAFLTKHRRTKNEEREHDLISSPVFTLSTRSA